MQTQCITLTCHGCGKEFTRGAGQAMRANRPPARRAYCSPACRRTRETRQCEVCMTLYAVVPNQRARGRGQWCSRRCADIGRKQGEHRTCKTCGNGFYMPSCAVNAPQRAGDYCSRECYNPDRSRKMSGKAKTAQHGLAISRAKKGKPNITARKEPTQVACLHCGRVWEFSGRQAYRAHQTKFCSRACWYDYVRVFPEEHPTFIDGMKRTYGGDWGSRSRQVRERDGHTCQDCGLHQRRPALDVHHIVPRRGFGDDHRAANDLSNLVTLCKGCHKRREPKPLRSHAV